MVFPILILKNLLLYLPLDDQLKVRQTNRYMKAVVDKYALNFTGDWEPNPTLDNQRKFLLKNTDFLANINLSFDISQLTNALVPKLNKVRVRGRFEESNSLVARRFSNLMKTFQPVDLNFSNRGEFPNKLVLGGSYSCVTILRLVNYELHPDMVKDIINNGTFPNLRAVWFKMTFFDYSLTPLISTKMSNLRSLYLTSRCNPNKYATVKSYDVLPKLPKLKSLAFFLYPSNVGHIHMFNFNNVPAVERLNLLQPPNGVDIINTTPGSIVRSVSYYGGLHLLMDHGGFAFLKKLPNLKQFELSIDPSCMESIPEFINSYKKLSSLSIVNGEKCLQIFNSVMIHDNITRLKIVKNNTSGSLLYWISQCLPNLKYLQVNRAALGLGYKKVDGDVAKSVSTYDDQYMNTPHKFSNLLAHSTDYLMSIDFYDKLVKESPKLEELYIPEYSRSYKKLCSRFPNLRVYNFNRAGYEDVIITFFES